MLNRKSERGSGKVRWLTDHGPWVTAAPSPRVIYARSAAFTLAGASPSASLVQLFIKATSDITLAGQPGQLFAHLTAPATSLEFGGRWGGDLHNQIEVPRRVSAGVYDWLYGVFGQPRTDPPEVSQ